MRVVGSKLGHVIGLRCLRCDRYYPPEADRYVCNCRANVGSDIGTLQAEYDYAAIASELAPENLSASPFRSIKRYSPLLPIAGIASLPPVPVGMTPLVRTPRLGERLNLRLLYVKDDGRNPSASLKDRASAIALARAKEWGASVVATASTGNAAAALATLAAGSGQKTVIFVPRTAPEAKIAQLMVFGSTVLAVDGSYDDAFDLCMEACRHFGWYNRNTGYNPWMTEGKKTVAYEIVEQLSADEFSSGANMDGAIFRTPDAVLVSVGDGCIIGGIHKGFQDMLALGWIGRMPRLYGVQSEQSQALANAWRHGLEMPESTHATTRADSISVDAPRDAIKALHAVRQSGGAFVTVADADILAAVVTMARLGGIFAEPAGAATYAGLAEAVQHGYIESTDCVVLVNTGNGLKDIGAAMEIAGQPIIVQPTLDAVREALNRDARRGEV